MAVLLFCDFLQFPLIWEIFQKSGQIDFPKKQAPTKINCLLPFPKEMCAHIDVIKYEKTQTFPLGTHR